MAAEKLFPGFRNDQQGQTRSFQGLPRHNNERHQEGDSNQAMTAGVAGARCKMPGWIGGGRSSAQRDRRDVLLQTRLELAFMRSRGDHVCTPRSLERWSPGWKLFARSGTCHALLLRSEGALSKQQRRKDSQGFMPRRVASRYARGPSCVHEPLLVSSICLLFAVSSAASGTCRLPHSCSRLRG